MLDETARRLLDRVEPLVVGQGGQARILDIGTGAGVLALEALARWPGAIVVGADASAGMLARAKKRARLAKMALDDHRLSFVHAPAEELPLPDASFDVAVSSFVFQLVPDRAAAFREAYRVLRPRGHLTFVTWLDRGDDFLPDVEFDEAVYDLEIEEDELVDDEVRAGDFRSPRAAANELRRAGFKRVSAQAETLEYRWTRDGYLAFKEHYNERSLFSSLPEETAARLLERTRERFETLPYDAFDWRADVVSAIGQRPA